MHARAGPLPRLRLAEQRQAGARVLGGAWGQSQGLASPRWGPRWGLKVWARVGRTSMGIPELLLIAHDSTLDA